MRYNRPRRLRQSSGAVDTMPPSIAPYHRGGEFYVNHQSSGLAYLRTFPDFELGNVAAAEALGLRRILALLDEVGAPHLHLPIIHLAGTKGKGSTAAMVAAVLRAAGYHTGLFTQPHL